MALYGRYGIIPVRNFVVSLVANNDHDIVTLNSDEFAYVVTKDDVASAQFTVEDDGGMIYTDGSNTQIPNAGGGSGSEDYFYIPGGRTITATTGATGVINLFIQIYRQI